MSTIILLVLLTNILTFAIFHKLSIVIADNYKNELLLQEVKMKEQYYREIEAGNKKVQEIKHDLKNRLIALYAIEACEKIEASKRWIAVNIIYKEHTLILKICNSKEIKKANIALSSKRHYKQSGIGIHSVTRVVEKYNGTIEFLDLGDSFEVSAVLYGILSTENTRS